MAHSVLSILGLSIVIASSSLLFQGIAIAGAAYIAWLRFQGLRACWLLFGSDSGAISVSHGRVARNALMSNLLNPEVMLLYLALMPNFLNLEPGNTGSQLAELWAVLILINIPWQKGHLLMTDSA